MQNLELGCNPGQLSFILRAASDTLPTSVNLKRWHIQCGARCSLCGCTQPTTAHVLGGCPTSLKQERFIYCHNQVLQCLTAELKKLVSTAGIATPIKEIMGKRQTVFIEHPSIEYILVLVLNNGQYS